MDVYAACQAVGKSTDADLEEMHSDLLLGVTGSRTKAQGRSNTPDSAVAGLTGLCSLSKVTVLQPGLQLFN